MRVGEEKCGIAQYCDCESSITLGGVWKEACSCDDITTLLRPFGVEYCFLKRLSNGESKLSMALPKDNRGELMRAASCDRVACVV
jgi:hypothetical protein